MKRFEFRLERILKLKKQQKWLAEMHQKQAQAALDAAQAELAPLQDQLTTALAELQQGAPDASWLGRYQHSTRLADLVALAQAKVLAAETEYELACEARKQMAAEVESLLLLRGQEWQAYRYDLQRAQQDLLDEVGMRRWRDERQSTTQPR